MPAEQREVMESMLGNMVFDLAIHKGVLVYAMGNGEIEKLIDQLNNPVEFPEQLAARSAYPAGAFCYADFDLAGYFQFASSFIDMVSEVADAGEMIKKISSIMAGAEPIMISGYNNSGRMKVCSTIPADVLARGAKAGQVIAMDAMQKKAQKKAEQPKTQPSGPAPDGTLQLLDGSAVLISDYTGQKVVVLDFWASWCGPCRKGLPMVQAVADHFSGSDVAFYAVNMREDADTVKTFFNEAGLSLPVALDDGTLGEAFGVSGIPHTVIIGKDGIIKSVHTGFSSDLDEKLTAEINSALAE
jgi:thiol-disulfide isomerase/thioredoxin